MGTKQVGADAAWQSLRAVDATETSRRLYGTQVLAVCVCACARVRVCSHLTSSNPKRHLFFDGMDKK